MMRRLSRTLLITASIGVIPLAGCAAEEPAEVPPAAEESVAAETPEDEDTPGVGEEGEGGAAQESVSDKVGQDVDFTGEVAEVLAPNAFTVGGDEVGENPILVVSAVLPENFSDGDQVQVQGTVEVFTVLGFEEGLGLDLVDNEFTDFEDDPAVQASDVTVEVQD